MTTIEGMTIAPGTLLPRMNLISVTTGATVDLRATRGPRALVAIHSVTCDDCRRYVREGVAPAARDIAEWGGRLTVVVPDGRANAASFAETTTDALEVLVDGGGTFGSGHARLIISDEWGEVHYVADAGEGHELLPREEIMAWVRFLAIQCPECEGPEGEWRAVR